MPFHQAEQQQQEQEDQLLLKDLKETEQRLENYIKKLEDVNGKAEKTEKKVGFSPRMFIDVLVV